MSTFKYGDELSRDEFYRAAIQPDFPDNMQFVLTATTNFGENVTFSQEGIDGMVEQLKSFIMARILGTWHKTNVAPHELTVNMRLEFKADEMEKLRKGDWPWWALVDEGKNHLDGSHRVRDERR